MYTVGVDPSSRLVASIIAHETRNGIVAERHVIRMPPKQPARTCYLTYMNFRRMLKKLAERTDDIGVFIEAPTLVARAGAQSLIPQAQVNGALLAAASSVPEVSVVENVPISRWKKEVIKNGNASKSQIKQWCYESWRDAYDLAANEQDFYDASGICLFGMKVMHNIDNMRSE